MKMRWRCQAYRGMDTYKCPVEVEAETPGEAAQRAMALVPFGDVMQCDPIDDEPEAELRAAAAPAGRE